MKKFILKIQEVDVKIKKDFINIDPALCFIWAAILFTVIVLVAVGISTVQDIVETKNLETTTINDHSVDIWLPSSEDYKLVCFEDLQLAAIWIEGPPFGSDEGYITVDYSYCEGLNAEH